MFRYKVDVLERLKIAGYSSYRILKTGLINSTAMQKLRRGEMIAWEQLNRICNVLNCQLGDIIEHIPDETQGRTKSDLPAE